QLGINRLSIGIQSFDDERLKWMNRSHTATQAIQCVHQAKEAGISNISIDLIFGLPKSDMAYWQQQLNCAHELGVSHLSVYALTVERRTALAHQIKKGLLKPAKDALYADQFMFTHHELTGRGYEHYEISSYALPGARSRHNSSYWQQLPYLGVGPSAHSFDKYSRCWNVSSNLGYIKAINERGEAVEATEHLSPLDRYHEYLLTGLRRCEGIDSQHIQQTFGIEFPGRYASKVARWIKRGYMQQLGARYTLTAEGWLLSDRLISELFLDEEP
ncbi:MAG: coproporphyrinogen III oxidase family protein, partial [Bacteroidetes bacterium]